MDAGFFKLKEEDEDKEKDNGSSKILYLKFRLKTSLNLCVQRIVRIAEYIAVAYKHYQ